MLMQRHLLRPTENWSDEGYAYTVVAVRDPSAVLLDVSRVLTVGRMSPITGRRAFLADEEPILALILAYEGPARTTLVDQIIRGGPIQLSEFLQSAA